MMTITGLREAYLSGETTPDCVIEDIFDRLHAGGLSPVWISVADRASAIARARAVDVNLPLGGIPFAVKDNIDVAGMPTTAGCPSFAFTPERHASVVTRLLDAGAILIGKTNMDQFATGLVGTRSPYGACRNAFDTRYVSGGSSSGSAIAVATGLCAFSLGTDTAGSGRVPAAFNNLVGLKPTRGLLSASGVVPACRSIDCVSIFATDADDAAQVWDVARGPDAMDPYSRAHDAGLGAAPWLTGTFRFGIPRSDQLEFCGDREAQRLYEQAVARLAQVGGVEVTIDFEPFRQAAQLLYAGPWVAERYAAVGDFLARNPPDADLVVRDIVLAGAAHTAADVFRATYRLEALKQQATVQWAKMDVLVLPTTPTIYTRADIEGDPVRLNSTLGYYTNFVNLLDLAAIAVPAGFRSDGLPSGVSFIGPAFSDRALASLGQRFIDDDRSVSRHAPGCIPVAVVGAHLSGQPLNWQLTERGARLICCTRTAPEYRLFELPVSSPPKPGLLREQGFEGPGVEVEIWSVPEHRFGSFVAAVPPPLAIGSLQLQDGSWVKGFVCEPVGLAGATEITEFGGWRQYLAQGPPKGGPYDL
jgi:allophanate hydrolase